MSWTEKVGGIKNLFVFLEDWKTRGDIMNNFDLSNTESWHAIQWLKKMKQDVMVQKKGGITKRAMFFKTRASTIKLAVSPEEVN